VQVVAALGRRREIRQRGLSRGRGGDEVGAAITCGGAAEAEGGGKGRPLGWHAPVAPRRRHIVYACSARGVSGGEQSGGRGAARASVPFLGFSACCRGEVSKLQALIHSRSSSRRKDG